MTNGSSTSSSSKIEAFPTSRAPRRLIITTTLSNAPNPIAFCHDSEDPAATLSLVSSLLSVAGTNIYFVHTHTSVSTAMREGGGWYERNLGKVMSEKSCIDSVCKSTKGEADEGMCKADSAAHGCSEPIIETALVACRELCNVERLR